MYNGNSALSLRAPPGLNTSVHFPSRWITNYSTVCWLMLSMHTEAPLIRLTPCSGLHHYILSLQGTIQKNLVAKDDAIQSQQQQANLNLATLMLISRGQAYDERYQWQDTEWDCFGLSSQQLEERQYWGLIRHLIKGIQLKYNMKQLLYILKRSLECMITCLRRSWTARGWPMLNDRL